MNVIIIIIRLFTTLIIAYFYCYSVESLQCSILIIFYGALFTSMYCIIMINTSNPAQVIMNHSRKLSE